MAYLPMSTFRRCVARHRGDYKVKDFSCLDQFFAMAFAQLTYLEFLRDIEGNLRAQASRLYHMGFRCSTISRNTLANANAARPWQIYANFAQHLIGIVRPLYAKEPHCRAPWWSFSMLPGTTHRRPRWILEYTAESMKEAIRMLCRLF